MQDVLQEKTGFSRKDVIIILVSLAIGGLLLGGNYLHYQSQEVQHRLTYAENPELMTIERGDQLQTAFELDDPENIPNVAITVRFQQVSDDVELTPVVNGVTFESDDGFGPGHTHTITVETEDLRATNELVLDPEYTPFSEIAEISSITVRGTTGSQRILFVTLNIIGLLTILGPILIIKWRQYKRRQILEKQFPNFLRDIVEGTRAGMSLPQAIRNTQNNNYADLTPHVEKMAAKLEWGIPFEKVMEDFGRETNSQIIQRSVSTIIQTYRAGGNVSEVLETIGDNLKEIRRLRKERESQIYGELVTGYIVYFVFLLVLVVLIRYLLPSLTFEGMDTGMGLMDSGRQLSADELVNEYRPIFQWLVIVQSVFSGLVIGRLSEGEFKAGVKHVAILLAVGYTVALVFM